MSNLTQAIILAGGKGTRLLPYTIVVPKPMLPIGGIPVIEIISRQLFFYGFHNVTVSVGHLSEMIEIFLKSKSSEPGLPQFNFFKEETELGTSGPIKVIHPEVESFFVVNGDIVTSLDFRDMFNFHMENKAVMTLGVRITKYQIPLGSISVDSTNRVIDFVEKPISEHLDNIGAYVYSSKVLDYMKKNEKIDVNVLINRLLQAGEKVLAYRSDGPYYWVDIGTHADYERANNEFSDILKELPFLARGV